MPKNKYSLAAPPKLSPKAAVVNMFAPARPVGRPVPDTTPIPLPAMPNNIDNGPSGLTALAGALGVLSGPLAGAAGQVTHQAHAQDLKAGKAAAAALELEDGAITWDKIITKHPEVRGRSPYFIKGMKLTLARQHAMRLNNKLSNPPAELYTVDSEDAYDEWVAEQTKKYVDENMVGMDPGAMADVFLPAIQGAAPGNRAKFVTKRAKKLQEIAKYNYTEEIKGIIQNGASQDIETIGHQLDAAQRNAVQPVLVPGGSQHKGAGLSFKDANEAMFKAVRNVVEATRDTKYFDLLKYVGTTRDKSGKATANLYGTYRGKIENFRKKFQGELVAADNRRFIQEKRQKKEAQDRIISMVGAEMAKPHPNPEKLAKLREAARYVNGEARVLNMINQARNANFVENYTLEAQMIQEAVRGQFDATKYAKVLGKEVTLGIFNRATTLNETAKKSATVITHPLTKRAEAEIKSYIKNSIPASLRSRPDYRQRYAHMIRDIPDEFLITVMGDYRKFVAEHKQAPTDDEVLGIIRAAKEATYKQIDAEIKQNDPRSMALPLNR